MNNRGWGLREELLICLVITVFFGIAIIFIHKVVGYMNTSNLMNIKENEFTSKKYEDNNRVINRGKEDANRVINQSEEYNKVNDDTTNYSNLEDKLVVAGKKYINKYNDDIKFDDKTIITVVRLQVEDLLDSLISNNVECSGYIEIENNMSEFKYFPYIKCDNFYVTEGYSVNYDNIGL